MSIFDRIQRIAKANFNWLLDKVEPPEQELESRIAELRDAIGEGRACAATYGATFKRMQKEQETLCQQRDQWQQRAEDAVRAGDDEVARQALEEKVRLSERITNLQPGIEQGQATYEQLRDNLQKLTEQLKAAQNKMQELRARKAAAEAHKAFGDQLDRATSLSGEGVAFDRLAGEVDQIEAEVEIGEEIRGDSLSDAELEDRGRELQVDAQLRQLKEKLGKDE
ncbi:MAG: PspA/IM30 family protein [Phycisphaerae bacterium]